MPVSQSKQAANRRWNEKNYDRMNIVLKKGEKEEIKKAAENAGLSLNAYIVKAIKEKMGKEV